MPFQPGDAVVHIALNRRGRVLDVRGDRYRVSIGGLVTSATERELRAVERTGRKGGKRKDGPLDSQDRGGASRRPAVGDRGRGEHARAPRRVDLHGLTREAAREAVLSAVNDAALAGDEVLEIVHGVGTGRVREVVWEELQRLSVVRHIRPHPTNRGVTLVQL
jgi:dsDNA-specific endonuclease/ATPase MutS2